MEMMIITKTQMVKLGEPALQQFISDTLPFLRKECPVFAEGKSDEDLTHVIHRFIALGKDYNITSGLNVQKLLYHTIHFELAVPFSEPLEQALRAPGWGQNFRIKRFIKLIVSHGIR